MHSRLSTVALGGALLLSTFAATMAVSGDAAPADVVTYRQTVFDGLGSHMKATGMIVKGKAGGVDDLAAHAEAIHATSLLIPSLFPAGTGPDAVKTDALPALWTDHAGFEAAAKKLQDESAKLVTVAKTKDLDAFKAQFGAVGKSCGGCHEHYRADDK
ncbi:MAG: cytochrome c [Alphaproteobacteria bacterium]|nr:cytochrome c [Alphaproteobacteria bacterium]